MGAGAEETNDSDADDRDAYLSLPPLPWGSIFLNSVPSGA